MLYAVYILCLDTYTRILHDIIFANFRIYIHAHTHIYLYSYTYKEYPLTESLKSCENRAFGYWTRVIAPQVKRGKYIRVNIVYMYVCMYVYIKYLCVGV